MRRLSLLCCAVMLVASCSSSSGERRKSDTVDSSATDGADGSDGSTGSTGSAGSDGSDGSTGSTGSTGADGSTVATGTDGTGGTTGSDGIDGADGGSGLDGSDGSAGGATGGYISATKLDDVSCVVIDPIELRAGDPTLGSIGVLFGLYTCDGGGIVDLSASDLRLSENDSLISPSESSATLLQRDAEAFITLVLDNSPSVATNGALEDAVQGAIDFVDELLVGDSGTTYVRVAFFSKKLIVKQEFTNNISDIKKAINSLLTDTSGVNTTNLYGALIEAISTNEQAQQQRQSAMLGGSVTFGQVVVFTDGSDQAALNTLGEASAAVQNTRDDVVMISFGGEVSENVLAQLGKNGAYGATEASELAGLFQVVAEILRSRKQALYVLGYCTPKLAGEHGLTLAIEGKGVSVPIDFSAAGFDADGLACSSSAFGSACDGKVCGGLWCGGCASFSETCSNSGQCSTNGAGGTGTWGAECTADDDCPAPFICQLPKTFTSSGGQCTQICPNGNVDCAHADWICMAAQLPGVDSCEPSSGFFGSGAIISPFCGPPEAIENSEFSVFEYFPCP